MDRTNKLESRPKGVVEKLVAAAKTARDRWGRFAREAIPSPPAPPLAGSRAEPRAEGGATVLKFYERAAGPETPAPARDRCEEEHVIMVKDFVQIARMKTAEAYARIPQGRMESACPDKPGPRRVRCRGIIKDRSKACRILLEYLNGALGDAREISETLKRCRMSEDKPHTMLLFVSEIDTKTEIEDQVKSRPKPRHLKVLYQSAQDLMAAPPEKAGVCDWIGGDALTYDWCSAYATCICEKGTGGCPECRQEIIPVYKDPSVVERWFRENRSAVEAKGAVVQEARGFHSDFIRPAKVFRVISPIEVIPTVRHTFFLEHWVGSPQEERDIPRMLKAYRMVADKPYHILVCLCGADWGDKIEAVIREMPALMHLKVIYVKAPVYNADGATIH